MTGETRSPSAGDDSLVRSAILADSRSRRVLALLLARSRPMTGRDMAVQVAASEAERPPTAVTDRARRRVQEDLHHRCLPRLQAAGWVERRPEGFVATERLASERMDPSVPELLELDPPSWEALAALLARPRRLQVASVVAGRRQPLPLDALVDALAARGRLAPTTDGGEDALGLAATVHHVDLPTLDDVGLLDYDCDARTVTSTPALLDLLERTGAGHPELDEPDADA